MVQTSKSGRKLDDMFLVIFLRNMSNKYINYFYFGLKHFSNDISYSMFINPLLEDFDERGVLSTNSLKMCGSVNVEY